jgi:lipopolysaccharide biosynthesis regulator YciM
MTAYVEHRYESATDLLGQAVRMDPQFGEANLYLGICSLLQGNATDAVSPLQSASREKKPTTTQAAHFYLAKAFLKLGRLTDAEAELRAAAAIPGRLTGEANALVQRLQAIQHPDINQ